MNMPGFTAEMSLYKIRKNYRIYRNDSSLIGGCGVIPQFDCDEEQCTCHDVLPNYVDCVKMQREHYGGYWDPDCRCNYFDDVKLYTCTCPNYG